MRQPFAIAVIAGAMAFTTVVVQPAFAARGGGGMGGDGRGMRGGVGMSHMTMGRTGIGHMSMAHMSFGRMTSMGRTPPGWSHGNKTGWNGGSMPPGLSR